MDVKVTDTSNNPVTDVGGAGVKKVKDVPFKIGTPVAKLFASTAYKLTVAELSPPSVLLGTPGAAAPPTTPPANPTKITETVTTGLVNTETTAFLVGHDASATFFNASYPAGTVATGSGNLAFAHVAALYGGGAVDVYVTQPNELLSNAHASDADTLVGISQVFESAPLSKLMTSGQHEVRVTPHGSTTLLYDGMVNIASESTTLLGLLDNPQNGSASFTLGVYSTISATIVPSLTNGTVIKDVNGTVDIAALDTTAHSLETINPPADVALASSLAADSTTYTCNLSPGPGHEQVSTPNPPGWQILSKAHTAGSVNPSLSIDSAGIAGDPGFQVPAPVTTLLSVGETADGYSLLVYNDDERKLNPEGRLVFLNAGFAGTDPVDFFVRVHGGPVTNAQIFAQDADTTGASNLALQNDGPTAFGAAPAVFLDNDNVDKPYLDLAPGTYDILAVDSVSSTLIKELDSVSVGAGAVITEILLNSTAPPSPTFIFMNTDNTHC